MKQYLVLAVIVAGIFSIGVSYAQEGEIPNWVKSVAAAWANDEITDTDFTAAMKFLIENKIIIIEGYEINIIEEQVENVQLIMELTVTTDKESYQQGDSIEISGTVQNNHSGIVTIMMVTPDNFIFTITQVSSTGDGTYEDDIKTENIIEFGEYTIRIQYDGNKIEKKITIN